MPEGATAPVQRVDTLPPARGAGTGCGWRMRGHSGGQVSACLSGGRHHHNRSGRGILTAKGGERCLDDASDDGRGEKTHSSDGGGHQWLRVHSRWFGRVLDFGHPRLCE